MYRRYCTIGRPKFNQPDTLPLNRITELKFIVGLILFVFLLLLETFS